MHEAAANSLLYDLSDSYMPLMLNSTGISAQLLQLFPEMKLHYGADVNLELGVRLAEDSTDQAIQFSKDRGIVFGDRSLNDMKTYLQFYCSNDTTTKELALELEMSLMLVVNATFKNFKIEAEVTEQSLSST